jgi:hypothetical protein
MTITQTDLITLDYAYNGYPYADLIPIGVDTSTLDYAYNGYPFIAMPAAGGGSTTKSIVFSISQSESIINSIIRIRPVVAGIVEQIVYTFSLSKIGVGGSKSFEFSINQVESITASIIRSRNESFTSNETESIVISALLRLKKLGYTISESNSITYQDLHRLRNTIVVISETETITSSLSRLKQIALSLAESIGYTFSIAQLKLLTTTISELNGFSFGALRRTRQVSEAINEIITYAFNITGGGIHPFSFSINQIETISNAIDRVRGVIATIEELESTTLSVSRKREITTTISELELITIGLSRLKLMSYIIDQTGSMSSIFLRRVRNAPFEVSEYEEVVGSFNRARALLLPINEAEAMTINIGRLREQIFSVNETQGTEIAIQRLRGLVQTISNTLDYTFVLRVKTIVNEPTFLDIEMSWGEWSNTSVGRLNSVYNLEAKTISFRLVNKTTSIVLMDNIIIPSGIF